MINNSYYDDIAIVSTTLNRIESHKEDNETLLESFNNVTELYKKFSDIAREMSATNYWFVQTYEQLVSSYIVLESLASYIDDDCRITFIERQHVKKLSLLLLDDRYSLIRTQLFTDSGEIPAEFIHDVNRLWKESSAIGFRLDVDEKGILSAVEEYINDL